MLTQSGGEPAAREAEWLRVYRHYAPRLESFFGSRLPGRGELDVFLSDLWERAFLNIDSLRSGKAMWSWLITIGNNLLRDRYRRKREDKEVLWSDAERNARVLAVLDGWTGMPSTDDSEDRRAAVLQSLEEAEYEFLALYAIDGFTHEEIARRLRLPSAAASRQKLRRLRLRLTGSTDEE